MTTRILLLVMTLFGIAATRANSQVERAPARSLTAFESEAELARFVQELFRARDESRPPPQLQSTCAASAQVQISPHKHATPLESTARPVVIRGRVADAVGTPLPQAQVTMQGYSIGTVASPGGEYRLTLPPEHVAASPEVTLRAMIIGYAPHVHSFTVSPGDSVTADFSLCAQGLALESVVVTGAAHAAESVTNVQHAAVDEGGIVKMHGDHLVILRRGRLFTVHIGGGRLTPVSAVDAFGPDIDPAGTWYDELLVSGNVVIVIGYSYSRGGTEVGLFLIDRAGRLQHRSTYQLRSNDYYSSRNYSSRLVDGKLVFYAPLALENHGIKDENLPGLLPAMRRWRKGGEGDEFRPIASSTRIYRPARELDPGADVALHTVTTCDVSQGVMNCRATAVFGPWGHTFYVSPRSVYVWLSGWRHPRDSRRAASMLYRMPLDGTAPTALGVAGSPIDQFSFLESEDEHLNVLVSSGADGQWMWRPERTGGSMALLRVPLSRFGDGRADAAASEYRPLPSPRGYALQNRFVGDHVLYGTGNGWGRPDITNQSGLYVVNWRNGRVSELLLPYGVDRIEAMGVGAVIVGSDDEDLHFTSVRLIGRPNVVDRYTLREASQGELRSHGFFYRTDDERSGVLGLPVRTAGRPGYEHLIDGSASILFLRDRSLRLAELGELSARSEQAVADACRASCVDWYGNARPLFLRGRIFALLGYEIVEGNLRGDRIRETRRVSFAPQQVGIRGP